MNVYTGTDTRAKALLPSPNGSCIPGSLGASEPILWGQSALWREKLEVQGSRGPATAV